MIALVNYNGFQFRLMKSVGSFHYEKQLKDLGRDFRVWHWIFLGRACLCHLKTLLLGVRTGVCQKGKDSAKHTEVLRLRGFPFSAGKDDVMDFFKEFELSEDSIYMTFNSEGRPTGETFIKFPSSEDSKAAIAKDRMTLGSRYIELFPSSLEDLNEVKSQEVGKVGMALNSSYTIGIPDLI
ncbi:hypothetical protein F0562_017901 [Nyssa sinensis]|uniref:RRM domain-containing protein n=1 Tax=Nyssa sinensis TaxID=561372 RepID=A0A5J4ZAK0_9ASTE|nr:hypothetical protein F0562_017901 [Nyssa sinensis]